MRIFFLLLAGLALIAAGPEKVTIYHGGTIITMEGEAAKMVEAVAVSAGQIIAAGDEREIRAMRGKNAELIDLHGRTMLPGYIDAHGHIGFVGANAAMACARTGWQAAVRSPFIIRLCGWNSLKT